MTLPSDQQLQDLMARQRRAWAAQGITAPEGQAPRIQPSAAGGFKTDLPNGIPTSQGKGSQSSPLGDLDELAVRYKKAANGEVPKALAGRGDVVIFVSFSMPQRDLIELSRQAKEMDATLALRGLKDNSVDATRIAAAAVNAGGVEWDIHPELFKQFKVTKVPTFVVANARSGSLDAEGCSPEATYASVSGSISLEQALDIVRRKARPDISAIADTRLVEYRAKNAPKRLR
ncbi:type-F conjugative transfer system pilin assembly protein TrbC [Rubrivivax gelatinosus]|uniref:type-F conjugative transfer system pilin assembly protein TrbC n=1 Tax=Rubrivivax gelatinosus TaxID=28068 RepID=UPI000681FAB6|nr:type-F conjugative transfer system pilin assembly protein TrbC [Rubrivivax gelatinosus]MBG6083024.1 conjugal transfer pilus assembly protein TrbC [Rubrivivax gelatinosus]